MRVKKIISVFILITSLLFSIPIKVNANSSIPWMNHDWKYRMKIRINHTNVDVVLTDFPVMVYLNLNRIEWIYTQNNGGDIRFTSSDGQTILSYEIEDWNYNNDAVIWVKIPIISNITNTLFFMYYGNPLANDAQSKEDVWDDNYVMVQHMVDDPDNAHITDSTQYDNDGTKKGVNEPVETASGKINNAQEFDGTDDYVGINLAISTPSAFTILAWWKRTGSSGGTTSDTYHVIFRGIDGNLNSWFRVWKAGNYVGAIIITDEGTRSNHVPIADPTAWHFIGCMWDGENLYTILDGELSTPTAMVSSTSGVSLGAIGRYSATYYLTNGTIDEVRISNTTRSVGWIETSYYSGLDELLIYGDLYKVIITRTQPTYLEISQGNYEGYEAVHKSGQSTILTTTWQCLWENNTVYPWSGLDAIMPTQFNISSTDVDDIAGGTGAWNVTLVGLNSDWEEINETIQLNGQNPVLTVNEYNRINFFYIRESGSTGSNEGFIRAGVGTPVGGIPPDTYDVIGFFHGMGSGRALYSAYTIPVNKTGYVLNSYYITGDDKEVEYAFRYRWYGESFIFRHLLHSYRIGVDYDYEIPLAFPEKTDLMMTARVTVANAHASGGYDLILINNDKNEIVTFDIIKISEGINVNVTNTVPVIIQDQPIRSDILIGIFILVPIIAIIVGVARKR